MECMTGLQCEWGLRWGAVARLALLAGIGTPRNMLATQGIGVVIDRRLFSSIVQLLLFHVSSGPLNLACIIALPIHS